MKQKDWEPPHWMVTLSIRANELCGGPKGASICATCWLHRLERPTRWNRFKVWGINKMFWFDKDHCRKAFNAWGHGGRK